MPKQNPAWGALCIKYICDEMFFISFQFNSYVDLPNHITLLLVVEIFPHTCDATGMEVYIYVTARHFFNISIFSYLDVHDYHYLNWYTDEKW